MKAAQAIARNIPVWLWHDGWWPAVVVEPCSGTDETMLVVRLPHGISVPASVAELKPRDPALLETDRPATATGLIQKPDAAKLEGSNPVRSGSQSAICEYL